MIRLSLQKFNMEYLNFQQDHKFSDFMAIIKCVKFMLADQVDGLNNLYPSKYCNFIELVMLTVI